MIHCSNFATNSIDCMCVLGCSMSKYYVCIHFPMIRLFYCGFSFSQKKYFFGGYNLAFKNPLSATFWHLSCLNNLPSSLIPQIWGLKQPPIIHQHSKYYICLIVLQKLKPWQCSNYSQSCVMCYKSLFFLLFLPIFFLIYLEEGLLSTRSTQTSLVINKNCSIEEKGLRLIKMVFKYWSEMYFENKLQSLFIIDLNTLK